MCSQGLNKPVPLSCAVLCQIVPLTLVQVVSPPLGWFPLNSFKSSNGTDVVTREVHWLFCGDWCAWSESLHFWYVYAFSPLSDPDVGLSVIVWHDERSSFNFGLCGHKFIPCLFGEYPGLCTIHHSLQHPWVVGPHLLHQADGNVACEEIPVWRIPRTSHGSSLYFYVMIIFLKQAIWP